MILHFPRKILVGSPLTPPVVLKVLLAKNSMFIALMSNLAFGSTFGFSSIYTQQRFKERVSDCKIVKI